MPDIRLRIYRLFRYVPFGSGSVIRGIYVDPVDGQVDSDELLRR